jgi:biotin transport system substrate-specific component
MYKNTMYKNTMYKNAAYQPLIPTLLPTNNVLRGFLLVLAGSLVVALTARLEIPLLFSPIPITGQTFGVLLVGALLGSRLGFLALIAYLLEGLVLPVFAGGATWANPGTTFTASFLLAFPVAAWLTGFLVERFGTDRHIGKTLLAMLVANIVIYIPGLIWLGVMLSSVDKYTGLGGLLTVGMLPFIPGDSVKAVLAALLLPTAWRFVKVQRSL